jgi:FixJ family two-component response regulator
MMSEPTVFLVDDDADVRAGLSLLLQSRDFPVRAFADAEAFLAADCCGQPGCLILDLRLGGMSGVELQEELARRQAHLPIIFLSAFGDIPITVKAIKAGAVDFLTKPVNGGVLLERVQLAMQRDREYRSSMAATEAFRKKIDLLTGREQEVLFLALTGMPNKDIAQQLAVSYRTVEAHRSRILLKLNARSMLELSRLSRLMPEDG